VPELPKACKNSACRFVIEDVARRLATWRPYSLRVARDAPPRRLRARLSCEGTLYSAEQGRRQGWENGAQGGANSQLLRLPAAPKTGERQPSPRGRLLLRRSAPRTPSLVTRYSAPAAGWVGDL
jgi:hypothetical protein